MSDIAFTADPQALAEARKDLSAPEAVGIADGIMARAEAGRNVGLPLHDTERSIGAAADQIATAVEALTPVVTKSMNDLDATLVSFGSILTNVQAFIERLKPHALTAAAFSEAPDDDELCLQAFSAAYQANSLKCSAEENTGAQKLITAAGHHRRFYASAIRRRAERFVHKELGGIFPRKPDGSIDWESLFKSHWFQIISIFLEILMLFATVQEGEPETDAA